MVAIDIRFVAGHYHATPWGRHVNEGEVEWPPSPWRILRALIFTWHQKAAHDVDRQTMVDVVTKLAGCLPYYALPRASAAHTRHYMPVYSGSTTKVFDARHVVDHNDTLTVAWQQVELDGAERAALRVLVERLGYLGRAESWVEARLVDDGESRETPVRPLDEGEVADSDVVRVLAPESPAAFAAWCVLQQGDAKGAKGKKKGDGLPASIFDALLADTGDLRKAGWSQPPGSRFVEYARPRQKVTSVPPARVGRATALPTVARFCVASAARPSLRETVSVAERVHTSLVARSDGLPVFSGKRDGEVLAGHGHVHVFCEANLDRGVSHITLYAPMGFDEAAQRALGGLRQVWGRGGHELLLVLLGVGQPSDFAGVNPRAGQCPIFAESRVWVSRTPFVPTRHPKSSRSGEPRLDDRGLHIGGAEHDLLRLLAEAGFPEPNAVSPVSDTLLGGHCTSWLDFRTERSRGDGRRGTARGRGFRLEFDRPVRGPIALGYGSHFGLGLFVPDEGGTSA